MKLSRLVAGLTTAGLLGLAPLALSAPAQAVTNITTAASLEGNLGMTFVKYGEKAELRGEVTGVDAATGTEEYVNAGVVSLQVSTAKNPTWTTVLTDDSPGGYYFEHKPDSNAMYKVVYAGGTSLDDVYTPSESAPVAIDVQRTFKGDFIGDSLVLKLKVKPDFGKQKVKIFSSKKEKKGYKKFRTVKTDKAGVFKTKLPATRTTTYFLVTAPGDKYFVKAEVIATTIRY